MTDPKYCPLCDQPLTVKGDVAVCPNGHRWQYEATRQSLADKSGSHDLGERLPDE
jgi:hypothetical protein